MMKTKVAILLLFVLAAALRQTATAQDISLADWEVYSAMFHTTDAATDWAERVWVSSTGGINIYNSFGEDATPHSTFNANNGLIDPSINVLKYVPNIKTMLCGSSNGVLTLINSLDAPFVHITSIRDHGLSNPTINDICLLPSPNGANIALIAGGFGLVEFDLDKQIFGSSIFSIGDFSANTTVNNITLAGDTIWISTPVGMAYTTMDKRLNVPHNWTTLQYIVKDNSNATTYSDAEIIQYQNKLYVNLGESIYRLNGTELELFIKMQPTWCSTCYYNGMDVYNGKLLLSTVYETFYLKDINNTADRVYVSTTDAWTDFDRKQGAVVVSNPNVDVVMLYDMWGCGFYKEGTTEIKQVPNTPVCNEFCSMVLDKNGMLYATADNAQKNNTIGLMSFDGKIWTNYRSHLSNIPRNNIYPAVSISPYTNKVYVSSWGAGLVELEAKQDTTIFNYWSHNNSALSQFDPNGWTIAGQTKWDNQGRMWVVSYGEGGLPGNMLVTFNNDGTSIGFAAKVADASRWAFSLAIDANNTKWIGGHPGTQHGLYYFNERNTLEDLSDDIWNQIYTNQYPNLLDNGFNTVVYDKFTNTIWLGSKNGLAIVNNPSAVLTKSQLVIISSKLLESQHVNDVFIDATGNKWISTRNGIWVISLDGTELLAHFTTANTGLLTNDIQAVVINPNSGMAYIGTKIGLFTAQSNILMPAIEYTLETYPQPFSPERHQHVTIAGLTTESDIRIVTPNGMLIRRLHSSSKHAIWDGKDQNGNIAPPGVYLVIASSAAANNAAGAAKLVIVK